MRLTGALYSIRWRFVLANILMVAAAFGVAMTAASTLVNNYLLNQRVQAQITDTRSLGVQVSALLAQSDAAELYSIGLRAYDEGDGRMLIVNTNGIVQTDTFSEYNGYFLRFPEVWAVLNEESTTAYGFHQITRGSRTFWALYSTSAVIHEGQLIGAVLFSASIQDLADAVTALRRNMIAIYLAGAAALLLATVVLTRYITRPVQQLTQVALRVSAGDWSGRAQISGRNEIAELGRTFNMMCDRLQNLDQQRSEFVSDASHELRTPLASMKILVESLLYQDNVPEEVYKEFLGDINGEIDRLTLLITDLLLLSKMDTDSGALNLTAADLSQTIRESADALQPIAKERDITLSVEVPDELLASYDPLKLRQALNNLIENAIKYTREGGRVSVSAGHEGSDVFIRVADNGIGMPSEDLPHIFERFYRVDKARSRETGGTGLGLHIVRRVALMHGGRVDVKSEEGVGSTFTFYLPEKQAKDRAHQ